MFSQPVKAAVWRVAAVACWQLRRITGESWVQVENQCQMSYPEKHMVSPPSQRYHLYQTPQTPKVFHTPWYFMHSKLPASVLGQSYPSLVHYKHVRSGMNSKSWSVHSSPLVNQDWLKNVTVMHWLFPRQREKPFIIDRTDSSGKSKKLPSFIFTLSHSSSLLWVSWKETQPLKTNKAFIIQIYDLQMCYFSLCISSLQRKQVKVLIFIYSG